ncbi:RNA-dependent RNA polymerase 2 [Linum grandiflorum]
MGEVAVESVPEAIITAERATVRVSNIPLTAIAQNLQDFLESQLGPDSVFAVEIITDRKNWKSRGFGRVQFASLAFKREAESLSRSGKLVFMRRNLNISETYDDIVARPVEDRNRVENGTLYAGFTSAKDHMCALECWEGVKGWVLTEKRRVEFFVTVEDECYKLVVPFEDIVDAYGCCWEDDSKVNALLLKVQFGPRLYKKLSGPNVTSKFSKDRYNICKEDFDSIWVRTTDISAVKSIGHCSSFCWDVDEAFPSEIFNCLPYYGEVIKGMNLVDWFNYCSPSETVPLVKCGADVGNLDHEIIFQLNSLVHTQKISLAAVDDLVNILSGQSIEIALRILQKLHQLKSTCYDPVAFVRTQLSAPSRNLQGPLPASLRSSTSNKIMCCHRALITPLKIYCLGPELESSNYVVKHFAKHASDFMRVTFVEEDWSKLPPQAISTSIQQGVSARPFRTKIYDRILSILQHGFMIGKKKYEFLAFSASQLRSNAVWMFASNEDLKAEHIREWMGSFNKIRSVSKCAARMGQLFSASSQTVEVPAQDVEIIPDIEITVDDITYCFSDGIGKISLPFAIQIAQKCGLSDIPSAFQIRYGGYKGVIAVDRNSFRKLSLRPSMLKFESDNRMLNITKCSDAMPCYLNREIISLLSTLGVRDEAFLALQLEQLQQVGKMLSSREAALGVLENLAWANAKNSLVKILLQGYEPNEEPYLSMMLQSYHDNMLSELRGRCRILVPKGRVLIGCLDESGILEYGQVYVRLTRTKKELQCGDQSFFRNVDEKTSVITGKVVVTKNPCLHPGDIRVLDAVYHEVLEEKGLVDCILFPQKGPRPHPNECSGGDLDGDLYFVSWDEDLIPPKTVAPMDYVGGRPRIMDHTVKMEEIHKFFVDYMVNDTLGAISTAHLVLADKEPDKACSEKCLELANLHSMAVDFAKTGAPAEMPKYLKPRVYPDFMERTEKPMYVSNGILGKLYRAALNSSTQAGFSFVWSRQVAEASYDSDLEVDGFSNFLQIAAGHRTMYMEKMRELMNYYDAKHEDEILTGNLRTKAAYLQRDNRRFGETKDRILVAMKSLQKDAKDWFESSCNMNDYQRLASAWYHVTYHPDHFEDGVSGLSFPWIVVDILLGIKSMKNRKVSESGDSSCASNAT